MSVTSASSQAHQTEPGDHHVQSFARGLAVIRSFHARAPQQSITEVAAATGLTRAGARRILLTLLGLGYVEQDGRQFRLTAKVLDLGYAYLTSLPTWSLAEPVLEALVRKVHESSSVAVLDGADVVYVLRIPTQKIMTLNLAVGSRLPSHCTSLGRVLLACLPPDRRDTALAASVQAHPDFPASRDLAVLRAQLDTVRQQGWALVDEELESGLISLAAPLRNARGQTVAAVNLSSHRSRTTAAEMVGTLLPDLLRAADEISQGIRP